MSKKQELETLRIVFLGEPGAGMKTIIDAFAFNTRRLDKKAKDNTDYVYSEITIGKKKYELLIFNLFKNPDLLEMFYTPAAIFYLYDVANRDMFDKFVTRYLRTIRKYVSKDEYPDTIIALVGNILDKNAKEVVSQEELDNIVKNYGVHTYKISKDDISSLDKLFVGTLRLHLGLDEKDDDDGKKCNCCSIY